MGDMESLMPQAFFTLSLGIGSMTICGSYVGRGHSLVKETAIIIAIPIIINIINDLKELVNEKSIELYGTVVAN